MRCDQRNVVLVKGYGVADAATGTPGTDNGFTSSQRSLAQDRSMAFCTSATARASVNPGSPCTGKLNQGPDIIFVGYGGRGAFGLTQKCVPCPGMAVGREPIYVCADAPGRSRRGHGRRVA